MSDREQSDTMEGLRTGVEVIGDEVVVRLTDGVEKAGTKLLVELLPF